MLEPIREDKLLFTFPDGWFALKYDKTSFHKEHFQKLADSKGIDIVAFDQRKDILWLIEINDYRCYKGEKPKNVKSLNSHFLEELGEKVRDTLASLYLAERRPHVGIYDFAKKASKKSTIKVVWHFEQTNKPSKIKPEAIDWQDAHLLLRKAVGIVDPHPLLCSMDEMRGCPWQVREITD
ncbi:hypothetical protein [Methylomagnum ishizawai]|uniref:hypothetical protein n=1 Tax=Methylomagnum ishizawai TaxID=1760988 RepID=UPI001C33530A|nr:hypothetical protein [Methylomagnum ishizawai]BBL76795.1 hypothetical protein MishRS11D_38930 [Methylomagnum ishizawai]